VSVSYRVVTEPGSEPITLQEAKDYCRIDFSDSGNDGVISGLIQSARKYVEQVTGRALATQSILAQFIIDRPHGGVLSGPIDDEQENFYHYEQQLGANPFGISQFFFELPMAPLQSVQLVGTQFTVFQVDGSGNPSFTALPRVAADGVTINWSIDTTREPGRIYFQAPLIVYRWQFQYTAGYDGVNYILPYDLRLLVKKIISFWYDNREGDALPSDIKNELLGYRLEWL